MLYYSHNKEPPKPYSSYKGPYFRAFASDLEFLVRVSESGLSGGSRLIIKKLQPA